MATTSTTPISKHPAGLSSAEARNRLEKSGPNAMPDTGIHPLRRALAQFWAPVPWMLEAAVLLEMVLGKHIEGAFAFGHALGPPLATKNGPPPECSGGFC